MKNQKSKIKNAFYRMLILVLFPIVGCSKEKSILQSPAESSSNRIGAETAIDSLQYYSSLFSPVRDVDKYVKKGGIAPQTLFFKDFRSLLPGIEQTTYPYACGNGMIILGPPYDPGTGISKGNTNSNERISSVNNNSALSGESWILDYWGNRINALGVYGAEDRQGYYVYSPLGTNENSPIVVLIHGGAWFSGPNPENINGCTFSFSDDPNTINLVKQLMNQGYVVVVPLYRLAAYGKNNTEIVANSVTWQDQLDDIDAAINHVRNNFPSCLGVNANSIQVLGESAGGHLALMWAYTKSTLSTSIVKSIISCYSPTNLQQYADFLRNKGVPTNPNLKYNCGANFYFPFQGTQFPYFPFWFYFLESSNLLEYNSISSFSCQPYYKNFFNQSVIMTGWKVIDSSFNFIQTAAAEVITSPTSNSTLSSYSPKNALGSRVIPTFILHGSADKLVPYNRSADGMKNKLISNGGLIDSLYGNNVSVGYNYSVYSAKHLMKIFPSADHGWENTTAAVKDTIRSNIVVWLNGHK